MSSNPASPPQKNPVASAVSGAFPQQQGQPITLTVATQSQVHHGPVPHPDVLRGYNELVPGAAERLIKLAEDEAAHRRHLEKQAMDSNIGAQQNQLRVGEYQSKAVFRSDTIGQAAGLLVSLACIAGAVYLGINNHEVTAGVLAAIPTAAVIRAFFVPKLSDQSKPPSSPKATAKGGE
jgi:uncharacterized membrane protein